MLWLALAFFPSVMLGAVTSHLTQEVAAVPFLWVLPLALYLLSFILCFSWPDAGRPAWRVALAAAAGLAVFGLHGELLMKVPPRVALWCAVLFVYAMAGHGELARRRPEPARLTGYYLAIAAGGALGGVLNAVVAPLLFTGYGELPLGILAGPLVVLLAVAVADSSSLGQPELLGMTTVGPDDAPRQDTVGPDDAPRQDTVGPDDAPRQDTVGRDDAPANEQQAFTGTFSWGRRRAAGVPGKRSTRQVIAQGDPRSTRVGTRNDTSFPEATTGPPDHARNESESASGRQLRIASALAIVALAGALLRDAVRQEPGLLFASRGFYGVLRVVREEPGQPDEYVKLLHGQITHGLQLGASSRRAEPTAYYGPSSGAGLAIRRHPKRLASRPMRVGVIGLGVGTLAAWSRPRDVFRFYEIDPEVARLSEGSSPVFSYLRDARGDVSVSLGDGRLVLEREAPQAFDVLVVDAFSSDAIPTHLLTREAFGVYLRHLAEGGVVAAHVTNRYLDLKPVVRGAAAALGLHAEHAPSFEQGLLWSSDWMLVTRERAFLEDEVVSAATLPPLPHAGAVVWTDDWSNLLGVLKR